MSPSYISSLEEMRSSLLKTYGKIPRGNLQARELLQNQAGVNDPSLPYEDRLQRHRDICSLLNLQEEGGLAGRDPREF